MYESATSVRTSGRYRSKYSSVSNIDTNTNINKTEFGQNLEKTGYDVSPSKDGKVTNYTKGDKKYTVRDNDKSTGGITAEYSQDGEYKKKIRTIMLKVEKTNQQNFTFFILDSSPDIYYKHFDAYGMNTISTNCTYREYVFFKINHYQIKTCTMETILKLHVMILPIFQINFAWYIYGTRNWEIGIVAFQNMEIGNVFKFI